MRKHGHAMSGLRKAFLVVLLLLCQRTYGQEQSAQSSHLRLQLGRKVLQGSLL